MPELNSQNMEHRALEADIERLNKEIAEKKNQLENKSLSDRELIKQTIQPIIQQTVIQSQPAASQSSSTVQSNILPNYLKDLPAETKLQIEQLIDLTFHQGIEKVINRALRASPFILDSFHDALTDKLHEELKKRKLI